MIKTGMDYLTALFRSIARQRKDLVYILEHSPSLEAPLSKRLDWLADLIHWAMVESPLKTSELDFSTGYPQAVRVKWLLHVLGRNSEWQKKFILILNSVFSQTRIFDLLVLTGLKRQAGLFSEAFERIEKSLLPRAPNDENMEIFFSSTFRDEKDAHSVSRIDVETFEKFLRIFQDSSPAIFENWEIDLRDAISYLALSIATQGSDPFIRECLKVKSQNQNAFYQLSPLIENWLSEKDNDIGMAKKSRIGQLIQASFSQINQVYSHMDETGVSVGMVYNLERIDSLLKRLQLLIDVRTNLQVSSVAVQKLIASLIFESVRSQSLRALFGENTALIAKKITENSAETGEHYIARTLQQYFSMLRSAIGGGVVTAFTTVFKFIIVGLPFSPFVLGFAASINYCLSFIFIQLRHYTLATKQPSMTAAALASQIKHHTREEDLAPLRDEILHLIRSQVLAVFGNVLAVVPTMIVFCFLYFKIFDRPFISSLKADDVIQDFSILGLTPWYAIWTGVLLFTSSLIAGWFYHWVLFNKLPQAIGRSERLIHIFGPVVSRKAGLFLKKNASGLAGNISLGFFLGLIPVLGTFLGLPLDIRHVTLSSGSLAVAAMSLGDYIFQEPRFWLAVLGVISMAILNLLVSFSLALAVAIRAKKLPAYQVTWIMKSIGRKLIRSPLIWIVPPQLNQAMADEERGDKRQ